MSHMRRIIDSGSAIIPRQKHRKHELESEQLARQQNIPCDVLALLRHEIDLKPAQCILVSTSL